MPYVINTQFKEGESTMVDGIGDSQINVYWNVLQKANTDRQRNTLFRIGTGVKAPTGNYSKDVWETSNLFPGTGSFDMNASSYFSINLKDFGLINENMFVLKTKNPVAYRYGNAFLSRTLVTYRKRLGVKTAILPFTGVSVFYTSKDRIKNIPVSQTFNNGTQLVYEIGTSFLTQKMMTTIKYGLPILQNISGGDVKMNGNVEFAINFLINKK